MLETIESIGILAATILSIFCVFGMLSGDQYMGLMAEIIGGAVIVYVFFRAFNPGQS